MPKRGLNIHENEVMRGFKTVNDSYIEPISFIVPRRAEVFQDDIFPPVTGTRPGMSSQEYFDGKDAVPPKIDLASIYAGEEAREVPSDYKPSAPLPAAASTTEQKKPELVKESPAATPAPDRMAAARSPPPSMREQGASMSNMAAKFADKDEESSDDDSSFEEVPKPVERVAPAAKVDEKIQTPAPLPKVEPASPVKHATTWKVRTPTFFSSS
jgi:coronin-1B/1C/6